MYQSPCSNCFTYVKSFDQESYEIDTVIVELEKLRHLKGLVTKVTQIVEGRKPEF